MAIDIAPSKQWNGNDGLWSTFLVDVGSPPQSLELLPATSLSLTLVVLPEGCPTNERASCATLRGNVFNSDNVTDPRWDPIPPETGPVFQVLPSEQPFRNESVNAEISLNPIHLQWWGDIALNSTEPLEDQVIAGYAVKTPFLGQLGINGKSVYLSDTLEYNSTLRTLQKMAAISSLSYSYTAGASYRKPDAFGSLVLGGYDSARVKMEESLTVPFSTHGFYDLSVVIKAISFGNSAPEPMSDLPTWTFVDSFYPDLRLPESICKVFEELFGLQWNETANIYWMNETQHQTALDQDLSVVFTLAVNTTSTPTDTVNITLPYAAFDLEAKWPLANVSDDTTPLRYFPLKQARSDDECFLGRAFLQEAYISADFDRQEFNIGQALFPDHPQVQLVTLYAPEKEPAKEGVGAGVIAGIVIGIVALLTILAALAWWMRRRRSKKQLERKDPRMTRTISVDGTTIAGIDLELTDRSEYYKPPQELGGAQTASTEFTKHELDANATATGLTGIQLQRHELAAGSVHHRPGHRHNWSFGSSQSGISPMGPGDRVTSMFGEPSPPLALSSGSPSPPLSDRRLEASSSPFPPFEMPAAPVPRP